MNAPVSPAALHAANHANAAASVALRHDRPIGVLLLEAGLIDVGDVEPILAHARQHGLHFGDAAVAMGRVKAEVLDQALSYQFDHPALVPGTSLISKEVISAYQVQHPVLDDLKNLRNQVLLRWPSHLSPQVRIVAVVSPDRGEGRTFVAANLAVGFALQGYRTLLIDADMRHPRQHELFNTPSVAGLSALLADRQATSALQQVADLRNLTVLPCGGVPPNPMDLVGRRGFDKLLSNLGLSYDMIIVDTPAASESPEASVVAVRAKACVLVARKGRSRFGPARNLALEVQSLGATIIGTVLMDA